MVDYSELEQLVRSRTSERLYAHCAATAQMARDLATYHGLDSHKAWLAGLLHDVARPLDDGKLIDEAERLGVEIAETDRAAPVLLHGKVGARIAETQLRITDPQILEAITAHTTGAPGMGELARIVFVADYAEPTRELAGAREVRALLPERLDEAVLTVVRHKIDYVRQSGATLDPRCVELQNELARKAPRRPEPS
jgi:predicted HD superfamily hydrolase involved in NAD metabolism